MVNTISPNADNNGPGGNQMRYAISDNPLGPWTYQGVYIKPTGSPTDHGSIIEYKGQWYAFYHNSLLSGNPWLRSICVDSLSYNSDGTIRVVKQSRKHGTSYPDHPLSIPGTIEAEDYDRGGQGIGYSDSEPLNNGNAYRLSEGVDVETNSQGNFNVGWTNGGEWLEYTVNVTETAQYTIGTVGSSPNNNSSIRFKLDGNDITGSVVISNTAGWQNYRTTLTKGVKLQAGNHILQLFEETGGFNLDKIKFDKEEPIVTGIPGVRQNMTCNIYPNPASGQLIIESPAFISQTAIHDLTGKLVEETYHQWNEGRLVLDINKINAGVYILSVYSGNTVCNSIVFIN